ncbi:MAG: hypothetical protein NTX33_05030 [Propionibacteriales bacterium]|nr:hypothetical protein [Propionibacteriales bacterium]
MRTSGIGHLEAVDLGIGTRIVQIAAEVGGFDLDVERDRTASEPLQFE